MYKKILMTARILTFSALISVFLTGCAKSDVSNIDTVSTSTDAEKIDVVEDTEDHDKNDEVDVETDDNSDESIESVEKISEEDKKEIAEVKSDIEGALKTKENKASVEKDTEDKKKIKSENKEEKKSNSTQEPVSNNTTTSNSSANDSSKESSQTSNVDSRTSSGSTNKSNRTLDPKYLDETLFSKTEIKAYKELGIVPCYHNYEKHYKEVEHKCVVDGTKTVWNSAGIVNGTACGYCKVVFIGEENAKYLDNLKMNYPQLTISATSYRAHADSAPYYNVNVGTEEEPWWVNMKYCGASSYGYPLYRTEPIEMPNVVKDAWIEEVFDGYVCTKCGCYKDLDR